MRLAKLTMHGFKSFADRTEFRFNDPIIGIVGPNGCGKSNVVDAIKWVLGERSAKSLRGEQMMDVIFGGTTSRKPAQVAEVLLTFENPLTNGETGERQIPLDTDLVEIGRRLHRDGTSEYFINSKKARLKDIRDIFLDTGVGTNAYSIIEQGKVESMLTSNPQERRLIFEEAAGVAKFKVRRIEAQRKLERTEINLVRCREQLDSAERRLRTIHRQAAKAREFKILDDELTTLRRAHAFDAFHELRERIDGLTSELTRLSDERVILSEELVIREDAKQDAELNRHRLQNELRDKEQERLQKTARRDQALQRAEMAKRAKVQSESEIAADCDRLAKIDENLSEVVESLQSLSESMATLEEETREAERVVETTINERNQCDARFNATRKALADQRNAVSGIEREQSSLESHIDALNHRIGGVGEQIEDLRRRRTEIESQLDELQENCKSATAKIEEDNRNIRALECESERLETQAESLSGRQRTLNDELNRIVQDRERLDARRQTLQEMQDAGEGLAEAVRTVLTKRDAGEGFEFVRGILADSIETDSQHAAAIEAAIGSMLQSVIVEKTSDVIKSNQSALEQLGGRVTFLPLDMTDENTTVPESQSASDISIDGNGLVRPTLPCIADFVQCSNSIRPLINRLLGRTYLVEDLQTAYRICGVFAARSRFVTLHGDVLQSDGRVTAGPDGAEGTGAGLLIRRIELMNLEASVSNLDEIIEAKRTDLSEIDERAAELERKQADLQQQIFNERRERDRVSHTLDRLNDEIRRLERDHPVLLEEEKALEARISELEAERREKSDRAASVRRLLNEERESLAEFEEAMKRDESSLEQIKEKLTNLRVAAGQSAERLTASQREYRRIESTRSDLAQHNEQLSSAIQQRRQRTIEHDRLIDEALFESEECERFLQDSAEQIELRRRDLETASTIVVSAAQGVTAARERMSIVERHLHAIELGKREADVKREELEQRTLEDLSLDLADEYQDYLHSRNGSENEEFNRSEVTTRIGELREAIRKLGNVNLDSIAEEEVLEHRHEDLRAQVLDLDEARQQLEALIEELNDASRDRFRETFCAIRDQFAGNDGMFRRLFGGGRADIVLEPIEETGEIDWLESGVDIIAKPPGKETRSISLLSGGEKTMTSVALLMAIFESKPSPFCLLDEVDAALDDANVQRFANVLRTFLDRSHFIVITHNKQTMQTADRLYGITMQERGVSTRVSVRFDEVGQDGRISDEAVQRMERTERQNGTTAPLEVQVKTGVMIEPEDEAEQEIVPAQKTNGLSASLTEMRRESERVEIVESAE